jgi:hypothetical protein
MSGVVLGRADGSEDSAAVERRVGLDLLELLHGLD